MTRVTATIIALWVWAFAVHAQIAPERTDSVNEAVASSMFPAIASHLASIPADIAAAGFTAGAVDSTATDYAKAIMVGRSIMDWIRQDYGRSGIGVDPAEVIEIIAGYIKGKAPAFTADEAGAYITEQYVRSLNSETLASVDLAVERAFIADAASAKGARVLADSVVVIVGKPGKKPFPEPGCLVSVVYEASLSNGTVFDTTDSQPITLSFDTLAPGLRAGLATLGKDGSALIYIPAAAGYGSEGYPGVIPGNASLFYNIRLVDIKTPDK